MKKSVHILLAFLLLISTSGVSISKHYCGGELKQITLSDTASSCNEHSSMPMDCCEDETQSFQVDEDFQVTPILSNISSPNVFLVAITFIPNSLYQTPILKRDFNTNNVPPLIPDHIFIRVQSFLL